MENREIKFRGREYIDGDRVYGFFTTYDGRAYIKSIERNQRFGCGIEVRPETVGQYTGLKDADGVEIYQDDRVECLIDGEAYGEPDIIGFEKGAFWLRRRNRSMASWLEIEEYQGKEVVADFRVIGNIHESPPPAAQ